MYHALSPALHVDAGDLLRKLLAFHSGEQEHQADGLSESGSRYRFYMKAYGTAYIAYKMYV